MGTTVRIKMTSGLHFTGGVNSCHFAGRRRRYAVYLYYIYETRRTGRAETWTNTTIEGRGGEKLRAKETDQEREKRRVHCVYMMCTCIIRAAYLWFLLLLLLFWTNRQTNRLHIVFWREWIGKVVDGCNSARSSWDNLSRGSFAAVGEICVNEKSDSDDVAHKSNANGVNHFAQTLLYVCLTYGPYKR